jgi:outer membrane murein-binding lipoprotein Lpp
MLTITIVVVGTCLLAVCSNDILLCLVEPRQYGKW